MKEGARLTLSGFHAVQEFIHFLEALKLLNFHTFLWLLTKVGTHQGMGLFLHYPGCACCLLNKLNQRLTLLISISLLQVCGTAGGYSVSSSQVLAELGAHVNAQKGR